MAQPRHAFACARGRGKTGVSTDRDKIEFRLFNSSSIFNITLREELFSYRSKTTPWSWFHGASHLSQVPWREVEGHYSPYTSITVDSQRHCPKKMPYILRCTSVTVDCQYLLADRRLFCRRETDCSPVRFDCHSLFCGKWAVNIRHPLCLRHPVTLDMCQYLEIYFGFEQAGQAWIEENSASIYTSVAKKSKQVHIAKSPHWHNNLFCCQSL